MKNEGHVELDISKVIVTGAAGSGKTSTKLLLYKRDPQTERQSTDLIEPMDRAYIKHEVAYHIEESDNEYEWIIVETGSDKLYSMLAATVVDGGYKCEYKVVEHVPSQELLTKVVEVSDLNLSQATLQPASLESLPTKQQPASIKTPEQIQTFQRQDSEARKSLLLELKNLDKKGECVHKVR